MLRNIFQIVVLWLFVVPTAFANPVISGKQTHTITSPSSGGTHSLHQPLTVQFSPNSGYNYSYQYYMVWHTVNDGPYELLRPTTTSVTLDPLASGANKLVEGTHKFAVRSVYVNSDGTIQYGAYSPMVTVNVNLQINYHITHNLAALPSAIFDTQPLNLKLDHTNEFFKALKYDYFFVNQNNGQAFHRPYNTDFTLTGLPAETDQCFNARSVYKTVFSSYGTQRCVRINKDISGEQTHDISPLPAEIELGTSLQIQWSAKNSFYGDLSADSFKVNHNNSEYTVYGNSWHFTPTHTGSHCFNVKMRYKGKDGNPSQQVCVNVYENAQNLFREGDFNNLGQVGCSHMPRHWHGQMFSRADPNSPPSNVYNGHIVALTHNNINYFGDKTNPEHLTIKDCAQLDNDTDSGKLKVSEEARIEMAKNGAGNNAMVYVKTHTCATHACKDNYRAEIGYDYKNYPFTYYSDSQVVGGSIKPSRHTQEGDTFWVAYRFNLVKGFHHEGYSPSQYDSPFAIITQIHPNTLSGTGAGIGDYTPVIKMTLSPIAREYNELNATKAYLNFEAKRNGNTVALGERQEIDLKSWYQLKLGIVFSENNSIGRAVAAIRKEGDPDQSWKYFKVGTNQALFTGRTILTARCPRSDADVPSKYHCAHYFDGHQETVFKMGAYYGNTFVDANGNRGTDKQIEILFDDVFSTNQSATSQFRWPLIFRSNNDVDEFTSKGFGTSPIDP